MSVPALAVSIGFALIYIFKLRQTGREVFGQKIWWDALRPIHSLLWALFAYMAFIGNKEAWKILFIDTIFGLLSFIVFHIAVGSFTKC